MGLLALGTPLPWDEARKHADQVRDLGIKQLLQIWNKYRKNERDVLLWGDEVEYLVVAYDEETKNARLSLRQAEILAELARGENLRKAGGGVPDVQEAVDVSEPLPTFHPEFGRFMLEATPGAPFGLTWKDLLAVEGNMKLRRAIAREHMAENEAPITLPSFPMLGTKGVFTQPYYPPTGPQSRSQFIPDEAINPHIRFPTLAANIRSRRGMKVAINMPIFYDENTPRPFNDPTIDYDRHLYPEDDDVRNGAAKEGHIYMDAMGFGMGCCCLQITFQAKNITEARQLYDQLCPLGPVMLALTAASPIFKGFLADIDVRWNVISGAVDDRTEEEKGLKPQRDSRYVIPKSRYDSVSTYISQDPALRPEYNDLDLVIDKDIKRRLVGNGMDERLATHFAHLFIRDPLVIFRETLGESPDDKADHFENIQSTNWQHMRFKPPPPGGNIGWRVEFRSMEIQVTDHENAAFAIFIVLLTRAILSYGLNFYIPISKVDENMATAHYRDAVLTKKFWFRKNLFPPRKPAANGSRTPVPSCPGTPPPVEDEYTLMTIDEIMNGRQDEFVGLIPLIESYLNTVNVDVITRCELAGYLSLVSKRASGELQTGATWIREFVRNHPDYKKDSAVSQSINYDLIKAVEVLGNGQGREAGLGDKLLGEFN
ncbi:GCS-domain-containing protein [Tuber magnatum]|uniref:Glutamate--cysteine ligase n=1 Tax=Tuber magnatum TaxID=42249 RepID=A0A317SYJ0_9PEZI|nr:GCS-domain-containing protein [Tuber magnatum]